MDRLTCNVTKKTIDYMTCVNKWPLCSYLNIAEFFQEKSNVWGRSEGKDPAL